MPPRKRAASKKAAPAKPPKKIVSGFCNDIGKPGQHEATKPVSPSGKPMAVCTDWVNCACKCHKQITDMYALAEIPRAEPEQPAAYVAAVAAELHEFVMPSPSLGVFATVLSNGTGADGGPDHQGASPDPSRAPHGAPGTPAPAPAAPAFHPTPTGRRARGQLEYDVLQICTEFSNDVYEWPECTPKLVAERIGKINTSEPPSTGAINAVWDRWESIGFAEQGKKPSRFVRFTGDGSVETLVAMKSRIKRDKKRSVSEQRRGIRSER